MIYIIATIVIYISYVVFTMLWKSILFALFIHLPRELKLSRTDKSKKEIKILLSGLFISVSFTVIILATLFFLFDIYNFGYSISAFIGSGLALVSSISETVKLRSVNKMFNL